MEAARPQGGFYGTYMSLKTLYVEQILMEAARPQSGSAGFVIRKHFAPADTYVKKAYNKKEM